MSMRNSLGVALLLIFAVSTLAVIYSFYLNRRVVKRHVVIFWLRVRAKKVQLFRFLSQYFPWVRRIIYILFALSIGWVVNKYGGKSFTPEILSSYLVAVGAMAGGTVSIILTLSHFLVQNTANLYSSSFYEVYAHDVKEKLVFSAVIVITIFLLGSGLYTGGLVVSDTYIPAGLAAIVVLVSMALTGIIFALIDWQYSIVLHKISPITAIQFFEKRGLDFMGRLKAVVEESANILQLLNDAIPRRDALVISYREILHSSDLDRHLEHLVELSFRLADKGETNSTKRCYLAVMHILQAFLEARKFSSIAKPSPNAFLALESDSQEFLAKSFERLNSAAEKFIREEKSELATYIVDVYLALAKKACEIRFQAHSENPVLNQIEGYLNTLIDFAQKNSNLEIVFQGSRVLGSIAVLAARNGFQTTLFGIEQRLVKVAINALIAKQLIVVDRCIDYLNQITTEVFLSNKIVRDTVLANPIRGLTEIVQNTLLVVRSKYLPDEFSSQQTLSKSYDGLSDSLQQIFSHYFDITDGREARRYESDVVALLREINLRLRDLSEKIKECDGFLIHSISRFIFHVNQLIIHVMKDGRFQNSEIEKWLTWNIHLPGWFVHHAEKFDGSSLAFHDLVESAAKTGVLGFSVLEDEKTLKDSANCILSIGLDSIDKVTKTYGFDEPRIVERAFYLGVLSQKKGWTSVASEIAIGIRKFEKKFVEKYRALHPDIDLSNHRIGGVPDAEQLFLEIMNWRDRFDYERMNGIHLMEESKDMMGSLVEVSDIDRFIFFVWGKILDDSDIRMELEGELKQMGIKRLIGLLKKRANQ